MDGLQLSMYCAPISSQQCDYGFVKDDCNCCDVCTRARESRVEVPSVVMVTTRMDTTTLCKFSGCDVDITTHNSKATN